VRLARVRRLRVHELACLRQLVGGFTPRARRLASSVEMQAVESSYPVARQMEDVHWAAFSESAAHSRAAICRSKGRKSLRFWLRKPRHEERRVSIGTEQPLERFARKSRASGGTDPTDRRLSRTFDGWRTRTARIRKQCESQAPASSRIPCVA
jgi:hypothetical protein